MLQYTLKKNGTVDLIHTEVPSALEGRGFGKHLAKVKYLITLRRDFGIGDFLFF